MAFGIEVKVCSLDALRVMKRAAQAISARAGDAFEYPG
jgi:hypothetical protein